THTPVIYTLSLHDALPISDALRETFTLLFLMAVILRLDWRLALISLLLVPFVIFPSSRIGQYIRTSSRHSQDKMGEINNVLQERSEEHTSELQSRFDLVCR